MGMVQDQDSMVCNVKTMFRRPEYPVVNKCFCRKPLAHLLRSLRNFDKVNQCISICAVVLCCCLGVFHAR